jgi:hypothetical protein
MFTKSASLLTLALALCAVIAPTTFAEDSAESVRVRIEEPSGISQTTLRYQDETGALFASVRRPDGSLTHYRIDPTTRQATVTSAGRVIFRFDPDALLEPAGVSPARRIGSGLEDALTPPTFMSEDFAIIVAGDAERFRAIREHEVAAVAFETLLAVARNDADAIGRPADAVVSPVPGKIARLSICAEEFTTVLGTPSISTLTLRLQQWSTRGLSSCLVRSVPAP